MSYFLIRFDHWVVGKMATETILVQGDNFNEACDKIEGEGYYYCENYRDMSIQNSQLNMDQGPPG